MNDEWDGLGMELSRERMVRCDVKPFWRATHLALVCMFFMQWVCVGYSETENMKVDVRGDGWAFLNPAVKFTIKSNVERHYDLSFAGEEVVYWKGRGVGDQTVGQDLPKPFRDLSEFNTLRIWLKLDLQKGEVRRWDQLFRAGSGDGNVHITLFDREGRSASAYVQGPDLFHQLGEWQQVIVSFQDDFASYSKLDVQNIKSIAVGLNILGHEANVSLEYTFGFVGLSISKEKKEIRSQGKVFPGQFMPDDCVYLLKDYPSHLHMAMTASGDRIKELGEEVWVEIDLPSRLSIDAVTGWLVGWDKIKPPKPVIYWAYPQMEDWLERNPQVIRENVTRDGQVYVRHSVLLDRDRVQAELQEEFGGRYVSGFDLSIANQADAGTRGEFYWRCEAIGLDWQSVAYEVMPALPQGAKPKRLTALAWGGLELMHEDKWPELIALYKAAGFNTYTSSGWISPRVKRLHELLRPEGLETYIAGQSGVMASEYSTEPGDKTLWEYHNGTHNRWGIACLTYCARRGEKFAETAYPFYQVANDYYVTDGLVIDYEMGTVVGMGYANPRCQEAFREHLGLAEEDVLNADVIREKYDEAFKEFRLHLIAEVARNWVEKAREINPDIKAIVCSGHVPMDEAAAKKYIEHTGTDPRLWDDVTDEHWPMVYYNGISCYHDILETVNVLEKPVVPLLGSGWLVGKNKFTPIQSELNALGCVLSGAEGYGFFIAFMAWDGMHWDKFTRVSHLAAEIEDIVLDGDDVTSDMKITGLPEENDVAIRVLEHQGVVLIGAINYSEAKRKISIRLTGDSLKTPQVLYSNQGGDNKVTSMRNRIVHFHLAPQGALFTSLDRQ